MNCAQYEKYLSSYIDNELKEIIPAAVLGAWTAGLEMHLQTCASCRQEYQYLLRAKQQLKALPEVPLSPILERQVMAFLHSASEPAIARSFSFRLDLKQYWLAIKVFVKRFISPPRLVIAGSALAIAFLWLGFFYSPQISHKPEVAEETNFQDINLEKLVDKHMESVYETTNPVHQSGVLILYNRQIQNMELGQQVNYDK
jgi:hypothetical protein